MSILVKKDNQWLSVKNIYCCQNNQWNAMKECYVRQSGIWQSIWKNVIIFVNDYPRTSINIFELMGSPTKAENFIFVNNAVISANYGEPALKTGTFPNGSKLTIINNSFIRGHGGNGGNGQTDGEPGGDAVFIEYTCNIDNSNGYLYGGGGGGGGVYAAQSNSINMVGGGGGAGAIHGQAGQNAANPGGINYPKSNPEGGNESNGGIGGYVGFNMGNVVLTYIAGAGGNLGMPGSQSKKTGNSAKTLEQFYAGGAAGLAINKNGFEVTLLNLDEEHIKGEIQ